MKTRIIYLFCTVFFIGGFIFLSNENTFHNKNTEKIELEKNSFFTGNELTVIVHSSDWTDECLSDLRVWACPISGGEFVELGQINDSSFAVGSIANGFYRIVACCSYEIGCITTSVTGSNQKFVVDVWLEPQNPPIAECNYECICASKCDAHVDDDKISLSSLLSKVDGIPNSYNLKQNYPNPFNPTTKINFSIPKEGFTTLKVFDIVGREVATLVASKLQTGNYDVEFTGRNLASGVYFYQLVSNDFVSVKKMILTK